MEKKFKIGIEFYIALTIALLCSIALFFILDHEEKVDIACSAIVSNENEKAKLYIDELWNINGTGTNDMTVLMTACACGNAEIIEYVVEKGANVNYTPSGMLSPLELFCDSGYEAGADALRTMFRAGLRQSLYTNKPAIFLLADNFYWLENKQKDVVTEVAIVLLKNGAPLGYNNTTLLHLAAKGNMDDLFYSIVHTQEGLYMLNVADENGDTPWLIAVKNGAVSVQKVIRNLEKEYEDSKNEGQNNDVWTEIIPDATQGTTEPTYGSDETQNTDKTNTP